MAAKKLQININAYCSLGEGANEWLLQHHGRSIHPPQKKAFYPDPEFTIWHVNEVFKGGYREV